VLGADWVSFILPSSGSERKSVVCPTAIIDLLLCFPSRPAGPCTSYERKVAQEKAWITDVSTTAS
jgi:hypothetical protein